MLLLPGQGSPSKKPTYSTGAWNNSSYSDWICRQMLKPKISAYRTHTYPGLESELFQYPFNGGDGASNIFVWVEGRQEEKAGKKYLLHLVSPNQNFRGN